MGTEPPSWYSARETMGKTGGRKCCRTSRAHATRQTPVLVPRALEVGAEWRSKAQTPLLGPGTVTYLSEPRLSSKSNETVAPVPKAGSPGWVAWWSPPTRNFCWPVM